MFKKIFEEFFCLIVYPKTQWGNIQSENFSYQSLVSEKLIPSLGIVSLFLFLSNLFQQIDLILNLKQVTILFASIYFSFILTIKFFYRLFLGKLEINKEQFSTYLTTLILTYVLLLTVSYLLIVFIDLSYFEYLVYLTYLVAYTGAIYFFKHSKLQSVITSVVILTFYILLYKLGELCLLFIANNSNFDLLKL